jgi:hypothetical protein
MENAARARMMLDRTPRPITPILKARSLPI